MSDADVVRHAAEQAALAPSIHNTQPWRFVVDARTLSILLDRRRQLAVVDPRHRQAIISCGCAVFNARVAIAGCGRDPVVHRFPDPARPDLLATVSLGGADLAGRVGRLGDAVGRRHTNRRPFGHEPLGASVVARLAWACREESSELRLVDTPRELDAVARLVRSAEEFEAADSAYRTELAAWTTDDLRRGDGVQAMAVPYGGDAGDRGASVVRQFDPRGMGWLPNSLPLTSRRFDDLLVVWTHTDDPFAWLRAGEALERIWLELTLLGFWASPVGQPVEIRQTREDLHRLLRLPGYPQMVLRTGRAPAVPPSRRLPFGDVSDEA